MSRFKPRNEADEMGSLSTSCASLLESWNLISWEKRLLLTNCRKLWLMWNTAGMSLRLCRRIQTGSLRLWIYFVWRWVVERFTCDRSIADDLRNQQKMWYNVRSEMEIGDAESDDVWWTIPSLKCTKDDSVLAGKSDSKTTDYEKGKLYCNGNSKRSLGKEQWIHFWLHLRHEQLELRG